MSNGRRYLIDHVKNFYAANSKPSKTDAQLRQVIGKGAEPTEQAQAWNY
jgi:hypothetical protein